MRRILLLTALLCPAMGAHAQDDYAALLDDAIAAIYWQFEQEWAFTETSLLDDKLWVGRHDPRGKEDKRWTLVSVDGREPTARERREYLHGKETRGGDDADDNRVVRIVQRDSLELLEETDRYWLFSFVPDDDQEFMNALQATLRIVKDGRYVASLNLRNTGDLKPGFGTKLSSFLIKLTFGPAVDGGPIVPKDVMVRVAGRALLFISIGETEIVEYSDFEYAGD